MKRLLRVFLGPLSAGEARLEGAQFRYVARVHRLRPGDELVAFDPEARLETRARVVEVGRHHAVCCLEAPGPARLVSPVRLTLVQCVGKGEKPDRVVRDATALGATTIVLATSSRTVVRLDARSEARQRRWQRLALDAARQSQRGDVPSVEGPIPLRQALDDVAGRGGSRLCLEARAAVSVDEALRAWQPETPLTVLVGPEGGLTEAELGLAELAGFRLVRLGPFVLRTETAATAILGAVAARMAPLAE
jgi:16S rRNA (uracil1498-N3)-methyltransferase